MMCSSWWLSVALEVWLVVYMEGRGEEREVEWGKSGITGV